LEFLHAALAGAALAAVLAAVITPWLMRKMKVLRIEGEDVHKPHRPLIPEMGGLAVMLGAALGMIAILMLDSLPMDPMLLAAFLAVFGAGFVGVLDDLFDLRKLVKAVLPVVFALPFAALIGRKYLLVPGMEPLMLGALAVPVIALGITCGANAANMLEGFNGLGAGLSIITSGALAAIAFLSGNITALYILFPLMAATAVFLWFNRYPARIFPGDTFTLFLGAGIAVASFMSGLEFWGALLMTPYALEVVLKARSRFKAQCFGELTPKGLLVHRGRVESLTHIVMRARPVRETSLVGLLWSVQAAFALAVLVTAFAAFGIA
jgi:UDP-N-acetylglucosamine--dolichyl-phosphate N-acetylglucosaminephosphotransferase